MSGRTLKIWNGRAGHVARLVGGEPYRGAHLFVAAFSVADAVRMFEDLLGYRNDVTRHEVMNYWAANAWGLSMEGVPVERGIWVKKEAFRPGQPVRVYPKPTEPPR